MSVAFRAHALLLGISPSLEAKYSLLEWTEPKC